MRRNKDRSSLSSVIEDGKDLGREGVTFPGEGLVEAMTVLGSRPKVTELRLEGWRV